MSLKQLSFLDKEEIREDFYISNTCNKCLNECKIYCITNSAEVFCKKFKGVNK